MGKQAKYVGWKVALSCLFGCQERHSELGCVCPKLYRYPLPSVLQWYTDPLLTLAAACMIL